MVKQLKTLAEFNDCVQKNAVVIVDFTATWCGPCKRIGPVFEAISQEAAYASVVFVKVDVDENEEASQQAGITCMPTFQLYKGGAKVETLEGASEAGLRAMLDKHK